MIRRVAPDGVPLASDGVRPAAGGVRGAPARDENGRDRCVECLNLLHDDHGPSPYCDDCKEAAKRRAWQLRNDKRQSATERRRQLRAEPHWEGPGYTHGRSGLYIDRELLQDLREAVDGLLSTHVTWSDIASAPFNEDPRAARQYHQALQDVLRAVTAANDVLRGPFWPRVDRSARRASPRGDE